MFVDANGGHLTYRTNRPESPVIDASVTHSQAEYNFIVSGVVDKRVTSLELRVPTEGGRLDITNAGSPVPSSVSFHMTRYSSSGVAGFTRDAISLGRGDTAELQFANWTNSSEVLPLVITHNGKSATETLTNQL